MKYAAWLWHSMRGIRWNMTLRIVIGTGQVGLALLMVWLSRMFIDETIRTGTDKEVFWMVTCLALTVVGGVILRQTNYYMMTLAGVYQSNVLRLRLFSSLFHRQLFDDKTLHSGDVSSRLAKDIETVSTVTTDNLPQIAITMIQLFGSFMLMHWFDARLAWALVVATPVAIVFGKLVARRLRQMTLDIRENESRIQMQVQETMEHNAVLRSLGSEQWVTEKLDTMQQRLRGNIIRRTRFIVITRLVMGCTFGLGYLIAFIWGGFGLRNGTITFGVMTSFLQLVGMIQHPILQLLNLIPGVIHASASIDRLDELEHTDQQLTNHSSPLSIEALGIRLENVSFQYAKGDRVILNNFSHDFKPGSKTAIMGETGIGKTTMFRLLLGFIQPSSGKISIYKNGQEELVSPETRANFVFVPQGNTLMSGSIRYNLQLAKPDVTDEELQAVLHTACADFVQELPEGLNTELGERGSGLSEGQAQRIAIARGLLCPGTILLLDEISSSLDEQTEQELYQRLFATCKEKTMLFITHRSTIGTLCDDMIRL